MDEPINFEAVSEEFQRALRVDSISHCDLLEVREDEIFLIEETRYIGKDLLDKNIYQNEVSEIVKKMWGSTVIFLWYSAECQQNIKLFGRKRNFILKVKVEKRLVKLLSRLIRDVKRYKNGAYSEVKLKIEEVERER